jgi:uncharacterized protein YukE
MIHMTMKGMDVEEVRHLAQAMHQASSELTTLVAGLTQKVQSAHWVGPDRERFVADWNSHHASALKSVAQALQDTSTRANQDAQQQDEASNA